MVSTEATMAEHSSSEDEAAGEASSGGVQISKRQRALPPSRMRESRSAEAFALPNEVPAGDPASAAVKSTLPLAHSVRSDLGESLLPAARHAGSSLLFSSCRVIGKVTSGVSFGLWTHGFEAFICCSVGRQFHVYCSKKLQLQIASPPLPGSIRALWCDGPVVYAGVKTAIFAFNRLQLLRIYGAAVRSEGPLPAGPHVEPVEGILGIGPFLVSHCPRVVAVWEKETGELVRVLPLQGPLRVQRLLHPETFLNKLLVAREGVLELWNVVSGQKLHQFSCIDGAGSSQKSGSSITALAQSASPDVVAVGFSNGAIFVIDLKRDELLLQFQQSAAQGSVCALAFRSDSADAASAAAETAAAVLMSGACNGDLCVWGLAEGRLLDCVPHAHRAAVSHIQFLPAQPVLITTGLDNALIEWVIDQPDGIPRELKARRGHVGSVTHMQFYSSEGTELLTASCLGGRGHLGFTSMIQQQQNCIFSQKNLKSKLQSVRRLRGIVSMSFSSWRHFDWATIATAHERTHQVFLWSAKNKALEPRVLQPPSRAGVSAEPATAVCCSSCGSFCFVGYADGRMHKFNLQSCLHRGEFVRTEGPLANARSTDNTMGAKPRSSSSRASQHEAWGTAHRGAVCGLAMLGPSVVASASSDPETATALPRRCVSVDGGVPLRARLAVNPVCVDRGLRRVLLRCTRLPRRVSAARLHASAPSAVVCGVYDLLQDCCLVLWDVRSRHARSCMPLTLPGGGNGGGICLFKSSGVLVAVLFRNGAVCLVDALSLTVFKSPPSDITFDPSGARLLTAHPHAQGGVFVWTNKYVFDASLGTPLLHATPRTPFPMEDANAAADVASIAGAACKAESQDEEAAAAALMRQYKSKAQPLVPGAVTLSGVPPAHLHAILYIDEIKAQAKPTRAPEPLPDAPFFIPSRFEEEGTVMILPASEDLSEGAAQAVDKKQSDRRNISRSKLQKLLAMKNTREGQKYDAILEYLRSCSPTGVALALGEIGPTAGAPEEEVLEMLRFFRFHLLHKNNADLVQTLLAVFLKAHSDILLSNATAADGENTKAATATSLSAAALPILEELEDIQQRDWGALEKQFHRLECSLKFLAHLQMD
ncbi:wd g-beta repeat-containing protein [Cyclospora cayetanensis]|uniref:Wd g-beta repeat-containing protein n=1 Tax=Cyclospora cayetanensis TaxID=88456 RepID=A0A1D3CV71_9EIME|nr:wd g-beta repeat-containing protein [Cyclospora cayetanensis]